MNVLPDGGERIKVVLTSRDMAALGISANDIDCSNPETRLVLRALFKAASEQIGINPDSKRLLIEAYPNLGGGGILYFTPLEGGKRENRRAKLKLKKENYIYEFSDSTPLLDSIEILFSKEAFRFIKSSIFYKNGIFYLLIYEKKESPQLEFLREFCDNYYKLSKLNNLTPRQKIAGDYAVFTVGSALKGLSFHRLLPQHPEH